MWCTGLRCKRVVSSSYLAPVLLPEDCRLGVPFGLAGEGGRPTLSHDLVPRSDHKLGRGWGKRTKKGVACYYTVITTKDRGNRKRQLVGSQASQQATQKTRSVQKETPNTALPCNKRRKGGLCDVALYSVILFGRERKARRWAENEGGGEEERRGEGEGRQGR